MRVGRDYVRLGHFHLSTFGDVFVTAKSYPLSAFQYVLAYTTLLKTHRKMHWATTKYKVLVHFRGRGGFHFRYIRFISGYCKNLLIKTQYLCITPAALYLEIKIAFTQKAYLVVFCVLLVKTKNNSNASFQAFTGIPLTIAFLFHLSGCLFFFFRNSSSCFYDGSGSCALLIATILICRAFIFGNVARFLCSVEHFFNVQNMISQSFFSSFSYSKQRKGCPFSWMTRTSLISSTSLYLRPASNWSTPVFADVKRVSFAGTTILTTHK